MSDRVLPERVSSIVTLRRDDGSDLVFRARMIAESQASSSMTGDEGGERRGVRIFANDDGGFVVAAVWADRREEHSIRRSATPCAAAADVVQALTRDEGISRLARRAIHFASRNDPDGFGAALPSQVPPTVTILRDCSRGDVAFRGARIAGGAFHDGSDRMCHVYRAGDGGYVVQIRGAHGKPPHTTRYSDAAAFVAAYGHVATIMARAVANDAAVAAAFNAYRRAQ